MVWLCCIYSGCWSLFYIYQFVEFVRCFHHFHISVNKCLGESVDGRVDSSYNPFLHSFDENATHSLCIPDPCLFRRRAWPSPFRTSLSTAWVWRGRYERSSPPPTPRPSRAWRGCWGERVWGGGSNEFIRWWKGEKRSLKACSSRNQTCHMFSANLHGFVCHAVFHFCAATLVFQGKTS